MIQVDGLKPPTPRWDEVGTPAAGLPDWLKDLRFLGHEDGTKLEHSQ